MRRSFVILLALAVGCRTDAPRTPFNGAAALGYVKTQLDFGPRIPGSPAHKQAGDWIGERPRPFADTVIEQRWTHVTVKGDTLPLRNILVRFRPHESQRVLFITHWDTRPISDGTADPAQRALPMPGANDGASGVAMFIALAEALKKSPPDVGVDLLFVDGEDYGAFDGEGKDVLLGAKYFAKHLPDSGYAPLYGVLWDMIGKKNTRFPEEAFSVQRAPEVVALVWKRAAELGYKGTFVPLGAGAMIDDHLPLLDGGLRVIDVIDADYPEHHTPQDTFDKVSQKSLQISGDVAYSLVHE